MARRAAIETGKVLRRLRREAGSPSYRDIERGVVAILGPDAPGDETIRLYHTGHIPHRADLVLIAALADYYHVHISELLSDVMVDRYGRTTDLFSRQSWAASGSNREPAGSLPIAA